MNEITPYLIFNGNCREALLFYKETLNGKIISMKTFAEAPVELSPAHPERIFDSHFEANGITLRASDSQPEQEVTVGGNFSLFVTFSDNEELENVFSKLSAGGSVWMPLSNSPEGKFGMLVDKFGIQWMLNWHQ